MYDLDGYHNESLDRFRVRYWCRKNLSTSDFAKYLDLDESTRQLFEEVIWNSYISGYEKGYLEGEGSLESDPVESTPEEIFRNFNSGPGLEKMSQEEWYLVLKSES